MRWTVNAVCTRYLAFLDCESGEHYQVNSRAYLKDLTKAHGRSLIEQMDVARIRAWIDAHPQWKSPNTVATVLATVSAAFAHCAREHRDCPPNPIANYRKPSRHGRLVCFTDDEIKAVLRVASPEYGAFFRFCILTGARPYSETARLTAEQFRSEPAPHFYLAPRNEDGTPGHKTARKTGKARIIYLVPEALNLVAQRMEVQAGPIFRGPLGAPWRNSSANAAWGRIRKATGITKPPYAARHTCAKWILAGRFNGGHPQTLYVVAGLLGITAQVAEQHYAAWGNEIQAPLMAGLGMVARAEAVPLSQLLESIA